VLVVLVAGILLDFLLNPVLSVSRLLYPSAPPSTGFFITVGVGVVVVGVVVGVVVVVVGVVVGVVAEIVTGDGGVLLLPFFIEPIVDPIEEPIVVAPSI
jgi:hypothetical protein